MTMESSDLDIGALLSERRRQSGRSLNEAAEQTRIRKTYLESLEANRFEDLPGRAYVVGFLKVYAGYLGLDSAPLLEALDTQGLTEPTITRAVGTVTRSKSLSPPPRSGRWGLFLFGFLAVLLIAGLAYFLPEWLASRAPAPAMETVMPVREQAAVEPAAPVETAQPVPSEAQEAQEAQEEEPGRGTSDEPAGDTAAAPQVEPTPEPTPATAPAPELPAIAGKGASLRMLAIANGTLRIEVDGRASRQYALREGLDLTWPVKRELRAELDAPSRARFWLDGEELQLGEVTTFHLQQSPEEQAGR